MEIIVGRLVEPLIGYRNFGVINDKSVQGYRGESNIIKKIIEPISVGDKNYSSLYMLERDIFLNLPFNWIYVINETWLRENKKNIFDYSHSNDFEFQKFVKNVDFPVLNKQKFIAKEKNHLLTELGIPFNSIDKIMVLRNYPGYNHATNYVRKFVPHREEIFHYKNNGSHKDTVLPKGIEFILK